MSNDSSDNLSLIDGRPLEADGLNSLPSVSYQVIIILLVIINMSFLVKYFAISYNFMF